MHPYKHRNRTNLFALTCSFQKCQRRSDQLSATSKHRELSPPKFQTFCIHGCPGFGATNCLCSEQKPKVIDTKWIVLLPPIDCRIKRSRPLMHDNFNSTHTRKTWILLSNRNDFDLQLPEKYETKRNPAMSVGCMQDLGTTPLTSIPPEMACCGGSVNHLTISRFLKLCHFLPFLV